MNLVEEWDKDSLPGGGLFIGIDTAITFVAVFTKTHRTMLKKFAMLATVAALFVACGSSNEAEMEAKAAEVEAQAQEIMDKLEADMKAAEAEANATMDEAVEGVEAAAEEAGEKVEEVIAK